MGVAGHLLDASRHEQAGRVTEASASNLAAARGIEEELAKNGLRDGADRMLISAGSCYAKAECFDDARCCLARLRAIEPQTRARNADADHLERFIASLEGG